MELGLTWLPLHIHDGATEGLADSFRHAVVQQAARSGDVTVVVPELDFYRSWHPLLHRRSARRIAQILQPLPGVTTVIVPYTASLQSPRAERRCAAPATDCATGESDAVWSPEQTGAHITTTCRADLAAGPPW